MIKSHLDRVARGSVEETLNALLDAEADRLCNAQRYERSAARRDTRAGHYERNLQTKAGEVRLKVPKLRQQTFETEIIERYRRRRARSRRRPGFPRPASPAAKGLIGPSISKWALRHQMLNSLAVPAPRRSFCSRDGFSASAETLAKTTVSQRSFHAWKMSTAHSESCQSCEPARCSRQRFTMGAGWKIPSAVRRRSSRSESAQGTQRAAQPILDRHCEPHFWSFHQLPWDIAAEHAAQHPFADAIGTLHRAG